MADKNLRISVKSDLRDGQKLTRFVQDLHQKVEKFAKVLGNLRLGGGPPTPTGQPTPGQQTLAKQLEGDKKAMEGMGREVENLQRRFVNLGNTVQQAGSKMQAASRRSLLVDQYGRPLPPSDGAVGIGEPGAPGGLGPPRGGRFGGGIGGFGGGANRRILTSLLGPLGPWGAIMAGATIANNIFSGLELANTLPLQLQSTAGGIYGGMQLKGMRLDPGLATAKYMLSRDPGRREAFEEETGLGATSAFARGGRKPFFDIFEHPIDTLRSPVARWEQLKNSMNSALAERAKATEQQLSQLSELDKVGQEQFGTMVQRAKQRVLMFRRFGEKSYQQGANLAMGIGFDESDIAPLAEMVSRKTGTFGAMGIAGAALMSARYGGWSAGTAASIGAKTAVAGGKVFGQLRGLDPAIGAIIGESAAGTFNASDFLSEGVGYTQALRTGVGGGPMGVRRAEQNILGMQGLTNVFSGRLDPYQATVNMAAAVQVMGPTGNVYGIQAITQLAQSNPRLIFDIMAGKAKVPPELEAMGVTTEMVQKWGKISANSTMNRYIGGMKGTRAGAAMDIIQQQYGGDLTGYLRKHHSDREISDISGVVAQMSFGGDVGAATGALRDLAGLAPSATMGVARRGRGVEGISPEEKALEHVSKANLELQGFATGLNETTKGLEAMRLKLGKMMDVIEGKEEPLPSGSDWHPSKPMDGNPKGGIQRTY